MCRLLLMTGLQNPELTEKFMKEAKVPMSWGNTHGLGYSATKKDGEFFTERWHNNDMLFNRENVIDASTSELLKDFKSKLPKGSTDTNYSLRGEIDFSQVSSVTMHTRFATCGREFFNTHPFVDGDFSLAHNGVIYNADVLKLNKISTCDSEAALQSYINNNVGVQIENAQAWLDTLSGYWAFGIFARDASGTRIMDVIRNDAGLYYSEVEGLGNILATTETIISTSCKELGLTYTKPYEIESNVLFRFDATTGKLLSSTDLNDSKLNSRSKMYNTGMSASAWESVTGKKSQEKSLNTREFKGRITYGDGSYKVMFKDGGYNLYSSQGRIIEQGVEEVKEEKKTTGQLILVGGNLNPSEKELEIEEDNIRQFNSYEDLFNYLYNVVEPLVDRLYEYDAAFMTNYGEQFEAIPEPMRDDSWEMGMFDDVLEEINEAYCHYFGENVSEN